MLEPAARKFTMADLMILIAGCAAGIAWTQVAYKNLIDLMGELMNEWTFLVPFLVTSPTPILASISVALLVCRLRAPRPTFRRLSRQPGFVALACVFALLVFDGVMLLAGRGLSLAVKRIWPPTPGATAVAFANYSLTMFELVVEAGMVIAACWLVLLAVGRWKPEPTWIDRSGRGLGACWIVIHVLSTLANSFAN